MRDLTRKFTLHDAEGLRFDIKAEVKSGRFSIVGHSASGGGQLVDEIKPKSDAQKKLVELWNTWHLNDMHAGTVAQEEALKGFKGSYDEQCKFLESKGLLIDGDYKYGTGWQMRELPADFVEQLEAVIEAIEAEKRGGEPSLAELMEEAGIDDDMAEVCQKYLDNGADDLMDFQESYQGQFDSDADFAQNLAEELGEVDRNAKWPNNCIDWELAARDLMMDYYELGGHYFRNF